MASFLKKLAVTASCAAAFATPVAMANIVVNPGFEAGITGWNFVDFRVAYNPSYAHSGINLAVTGCAFHPCVSTQGSQAYISQTLITTPGMYDLSFWVGENGGSTSEFSVFWNGLLIADVLNPANNTLPQPGMMQFSYSNLRATLGATVLEVHGRQDREFIFFDDFVVDVSANSVPEPATLALVSIALIGAAASRRKSTSRKSGSA